MDYDVMQAEMDLLREERDDLKARVAELESEAAKQSERESLRHTPCSNSRLEVHMDASGFADAIDCGGKVLLHLNPGTTVNAMNVDGFVKAHNELLVERDALEESVIGWLKENETLRASLAKMKEALGITTRCKSLGFDFHPKIRAALSNSLATKAHAEWEAMRKVCALAREGLNQADGPLHAKEFVEAIQAALDALEALRDE